MDLDGDTKVTLNDLMLFVGHSGGIRQFFEKRRLRISTSRQDVDHHSGVVVGSRVKAHFYFQGQKSTVWREATVRAVGVARESVDGVGPATLGCGLQFNFGPGGKWKAYQVVPMHWILGQAHSLEVETALRESGIVEEQQSYFSMLLPDTEILTMERLAVCQRAALKNVRQKATERHNEAIGPARERFKSLGYGDHVLGMVLDWVQDLAPMVIHVKLDDVGRFMETDEYYRSQFETKTSNGANDPQNLTRQGWERSLFGGAYEDAKPFERCKYGALNVMNDYRGVLSAKQYGDSYLVLKDVRMRTTLTYTDSSCVDIESLGVLDKYAHVLQSYNDTELKALADVAVAAVTSQRVLGRASSGGPQLELLRGTSHDSGMEWITLGFPELGQNSGKLYLEVHLTKGCVAPQVGVLASGYKTVPYAASATGVGDDELGWACDGVNSSLWHSGAEKPWEAHWPAEKNASGEMCLAEDAVVGVALDLADRTILFCTNGKWDRQPAFTSGDIPAGVQLYPALSVKGRAAFCFGDFRHPAPPEFQPWPGMPSWPVRCDVPFIGDSTACRIYKEIQVHGEVHLKRHVQRLVAHSKYRERSKVKRSLMLFFGPLNLLVSNAGGLDGTFMRMGAHQGRPLYKSEGGATVYWDAEAKRWKLNSSEDFSSFVTSAPDGAGDVPPRRGWEVKYEMRGVLSVDCFKKGMSKLKVSQANVGTLVKALAREGDVVFKETEKTTFEREWKKLKSTTCDADEAWAVLVKEVQSEVLKAAGFDRRCEVCETEHPYSANKFSWSRQIPMKSGAMRVLFSPKCQTYDSRAVFSINCGGMPRKAAGPGSRVEVSVDGKTIYGTVSGRPDNGLNWKVRLDRRAALASGSLAEISSTVVPESVGTCRRNEHYYRRLADCTVVRVEKKSSTRVSVVYDAHGDMTDGPMQDPMDSRLFWNGSHMAASSGAPIETNRDSHCSGTLFFDDVPSMEDLEFEYGSSGYSRVKLSEVVEACQFSAGESVEAMRNGDWDLAEVVEAKPPDTYVIKWADAVGDSEGLEMPVDQVRKKPEESDGNVLEDIKRCRGSHWDSECFASFAESPKMAIVEYLDASKRRDYRTSAATKTNNKKVKQKRQPTPIKMNHVGEEIKAFDLDLAQPLTPIHIKEFVANGPAQQMGVCEGWFLDIAGTIMGDSSRQWARLLSGFGGVDFTDSDKNTVMLDAANDESAEVRLSPQEGHRHKWYCGRTLGKEAIPGSNGRCGPNNGPQCVPCRRFQEAFQINDALAPVSLGNRQDFTTFWYCGGESGDGCCSPGSGPQCQSCKRFQDRLDALQSPAKDRLFAERLQRLVDACFQDPKAFLDRLTAAMADGTLQDVAMVFTNSASLQEPKLLPDVHVVYPEGQRVGSEVRLFQTCEKVSLPESTPGVPSHMSKHPYGSGFAGFRGRGMRGAAPQQPGQAVQIEEFLKKGVAHAAGVREYWSLDVERTLSLNGAKMASLTSAEIVENPNVLLALSGVTLVFEHPCPVKRTQVSCHGPPGASNWKAGLITGSAADVCFSTDGDGSMHPSRRWGFRAMFLPFDVPRPSAEKMDQLFQSFEEATKRAIGVTEPMDVQRDDWDEARLRALCEQHGWEFSWMTEDGEFQRRQREHASFDVDTVDVARIRALSARFGARAEALAADEPREEVDATPAEV
ncbi:unnamed protein product [Prorocentrum cordatum]|uniref:B30.2/SPRY domain-containing protein n=1 Tax=Prorocentrum cordatum TaxID=2364126 RepID=A0ABN9U3B0_9DINO|nr:unnamed protein product [Polarella glacialis]